jgi:hypothetical protein
MKLDRKLLLIAPTIVLVFIVAGLIYTSMQLSVLTSGAESLSERSDFIASVERGQRSLAERQAVGIIRLSLEVEGRRTAAITAARELIVVLAVMTGACCIVLLLGIRHVPREHWPRFGFGRVAIDSAPPPPVT